jgi:hypothetical protein
VPVPRMPRPQRSPGQARTSYGTLHTSRSFAVVGGEVSELPAAAIRWVEGKVCRLMLVSCSMGSRTGVLALRCCRVVKGTWPAAPVTTVFLLWFPRFAWPLHVCCLGFDVMGGIGFADWLYRPASPFFGPSTFSDDPGLGSASGRLARAITWTETRSVVSAPRVRYGRWVWFLMVRSGATDVTRSSAQRESDR